VDCSDDEDCDYVDNEYMIKCGDDEDQEMDAENDIDFHFYYYLYYYKLYYYFYFYFYYLYKGWDKAVGIYSVGSNNKQYRGKLEGTYCVYLASFTSLSLLSLTVALIIIITSIAVTPTIIIIRHHHHQHNHHIYCPGELRAFLCDSIDRDSRWMNEHIVVRRLAIDSLMNKGSDDHNKDDVDDDDDDELPIDGL